MCMQMFMGNIIINFMLYVFTQQRKKKIKKGRLFDKDGNLNKWWSDSSIKRFQEKTKCLVNQYNKYTLTDIGQTIDGESTQGILFYC